MTYTQRELTPTEKANKTAVETMHRLALLEMFRSPGVRKFLSHAQAEDNARNLALAAYEKAKTDRYGDPSREAYLAYKNGGGTELDIGRMFDRWLKKALKVDKRKSKLDRPEVQKVAKITNDDRQAFSKALEAHSKGSFKGFTALWLKYLGKGGLLDKASFRSEYLEGGK